MTYTPLVSVVIPIYNAEKFLKESIESVLEQTYKEIELILVDDYSTDNSMKICKHYTYLDKRVKYIRHDNNYGVSKARNTGLKNAIGKYICFIDADDFIENRYVSVFLDILKQTQVPVVYGQLKYYQEGEYIRRPRRIKEGYISTEEVSSILIDDGTVTGILFGSVCGAVYDLEYIKKNNLIFDETIKRNEDGLFNLDLLATCSGFWGTLYDGYCYRLWKDNNYIQSFLPDPELDRATNAIKRRHGRLKDFEFQMQRRSVSVVFWNAITVRCCGTGFRDTCKDLRDYINRSKIDDNFYTIDSSHVSICKKVLVFLLYKRWIAVFCFLMKFIYPILKRFR